MARPRDKQMGGQHILGPHRAKRDARPLSVPTFAPQRAVGQRGQHGVMLPAGQRAAVKVVESKFVFQFLVLLPDRRVLTRRAEQLMHHCHGRQIYEGIPGPRHRAKSPLAEQPNLGSGAPRRPFLDGRHSLREKPRAPRSVRPVAPRDLLPSTRGCVPRSRGYPPAPRPPHQPGPWAAGRALSGNVDRRVIQKGLRCHGDARRIRQLCLMRGASQHRIVAEFGIAHDRGDREAGNADLAYQRQGQELFLLKADNSRHLCPRPRGGDQPSLQQVELHAQEPSAVAGPQREGDGHLAIGDLGERVAGLPLATRTKAVPCSGRLALSRFSTPARSRTTRRDRRQSKSASQGACVRTCCGADTSPARLGRVHIVSINLLRLSLTRPLTWRSNAASLHAITQAIFHSLNRASARGSQRSR
jgi:hypothetical protein